MVAQQGQAPVTTRELRPRSTKPSGRIVSETGHAFVVEDGWPLPSGQRDITLASLQLANQAIMSLPQPGMWLHGFIQPMKRQWYPRTLWFFLTQAQYALHRCTRNA